MNVASGSRQILLQGLMMVMVGLLWGLVVPHTPFPRLALGAHIQFETDGMLFIVAGVLLLAVPHRVGRKSVGVMLLAVWCTWGMALSEVANAWWGTTKMLPLAAQQAAATGGRPWQEAVVLIAHLAAGLSLIAGWALLTAGFFGSAPAAESRPLAEAGTQAVESIR
jgi:hydroxylaminobenzene mutase